MINENSSWQLMLIMALFLGIKHGINLDHLATIDAMTRIVQNNRTLSKMVGFLFSLGHGLVVTLISIIIGSGLIESHIPEWLDGFGSWISVSFLVIFGALNLWSVFQKNPSVALPAGIRGLLAKSLTPKKRGPLLVMMIGALFALSFDTVSQVALFSLSASLLAGWIFSGILGITFMMGMMIADSLNGYVVSLLIQKADGASMIISRSLGVIISLFSLIIAFLTLLKINLYP